MENSEFKPVIDLEWTKLHRGIPALDILHEEYPTTKTKLWDKSEWIFLIF